MSEVLKEYRLYEELTRINHDEYFQPTFKTLELQQVFSSILNEKDYANDKSCFFFFYNLKAMGKKKPYLVLKWLIVTHQLLEIPLYTKVIQDIYRTLEVIQAPTGSTPFETYFYETLIKVYLQYLLKFSLYKLKKAVTHPERFTNFESQLFFMRVNLLKFGTNEFIGLIPEFRGFLEDSYPFLTSYSKLVEGDLKAIYKELKKEHRRQEEKLINWKQIEDYDDFLHTISEHNLSSTGCDDILSEGGFSPCKIKQFLLSGTKILDKFANEEDTMA